MDPRKPPFVRPLLRLLACLMFLIAAAACGRAESKPKAGSTKATPKSSVSLSKGRRISGPYVKDNLEVYLVHADDRDDRDFITLDEGLKKGLVTVSEKEDAEVGRLVLENKGKKPLFLQEGDRLQGGKQDRMVYSSLVVASKSGAKEVPSFCIEQSRWNAGSRGHRFSGSGSMALSPKSVRMAGKVSKSQSGVWHNVARKKAEYSRSLGSGNTNSSLNEALDSKAVQKAAKRYEGALGNLAKRHADAVGAVFVIDGRIEEVDVYPGHPLFAKVYPRLLQSFAMDAAQKAKTKRRGDRGAKAKKTTATDVRAFVRGRGTQLRDEPLDPYNRLDVVDLGSRYRLRTHWDGGVVHEQIMAKEAQD